MRRGIPFHVDACMGGMLLPFLAPSHLPWSYIDVGRFTQVRLHR
jgi:glutamate/tyrosine decarboxylase-like PLP-dependent enzyme